jgi:hypothetical protein
MGRLQILLLLFNLCLLVMEMRVVLGQALPVKVVVVVVVVAQQAQTEPQLLVAQVAQVLMRQHGVVKQH